MVIVARGMTSGAGGYLAETYVVLTGGPAETYTVVTVCWSCVLYVVVLHGALYTSLSLSQYIYIYYNDIVYYSIIL